MVRRQGRGNLSQHREGEALIFCVLKATDHGGSSAYKFAELGLRETGRRSQMMDRAGDFLFCASVVEVLEARGLPR